MMETPRQYPANIFSNLPEQLKDEIFETIIETKACKIERIISRGHSSPDSTKSMWYDQEENEWVMVLEGSAGLRFSGKKEIVEMKPGDHINIPAHCKHRVEWTDPDGETIWLAVHYK